MRHLLAGLGLVLIAVTAVSVLPSDAWWVRLLAFPRVQVAAALLLLALVLLLMRPPPRRRRWPLPAALIGAALVQATWILPFTPLHPVESPAAAACTAGGRLRLLVANLLYTNRNAEPFLALVRDADPDVVLAIEGDAWWDARLAALDGRYPFALKRPRPDGYGMHLISRLPLRDAEVRVLVDRDRPSMHAMVELPSGARLRLHGIHPVPPHLDPGADERDAAILRLARLVAAEAPLPAVAAGDFNAVPWSRTMRRFGRIGGLLDPRVGRGVYPTFHADVWPLRWPIDHVFHTAQFRLAAFRLGGDIGSDHLPVLAELCHDDGAEMPISRRPGTKSDRATS